MRWSHHQEKMASPPRAEVQWLTRVGSVLPEEVRCSLSTTKSVEVIVCVMGGNPSSGCSIHSESPARSKRKNLEQAAGLRGGVARILLANAAAGPLQTLYILTVAKVKVMLPVMMLQDYMQSARTCPILPLATFSHNLILSQYFLIFSCSAFITHMK